MTDQWISSERDTVVDVLARAVAQAPDTVYLDFEGYTYTFADFDQLANRMAHGLHALGVKAGDTVTSMLDNHVDAIAAWIGANRLGAIFVPINTALKGDFLRHQVTDSGAGVVLAESDYAERFALICGEVPDLHTLVHRGSAPESDLGRLTVRSIDTFYASDDAPVEGVKVNPEDLALLIYTSGTTGPSKGCMISHNYACNLSRQIISNSGRQPGETAWSCLPLFHMNAKTALLISSAYLQSTASLSRRFSVSRFWGEIERSKAEVVHIMGSMMNLLANAPDEPAMERCHGQIRALMGSPFPPTLQRTFKSRFGVKDCNSISYGLTEAAVVTSISIKAAQPEGGSGRRNDCFDVRIIGDDGSEVAPGQTGEIYVRPTKPDVMFQGYWRRPQETLRVLKDLWFHTGDIGKFDEDGFFFFVDRKKDYMRRRGENISSYELEKTFSGHADIQDLAIHSVLSPHGEDDVKLTAVLKPGAEVTEEGMFRWAVERLPYFALPRYIEFRNDLPRNPVGKVMKYQLRDEGCTPQTWDMEAAGITIQKR